MTDCHLGRQCAGVLLAEIGRQGLTFAQIAERAGVKETWVRRALLRGAAGKGMHTWPLSLIAYALGCRVSFSLEKEDRR